MLFFYKTVTFPLVSPVSRGNVFLFHFYGNLFFLLLFFCDSKTSFAKKMIFSSSNKDALCFLIIDTPFFMDSSRTFRQPVSFRIRGIDPPCEEKGACNRQNDDRDCEPFQVDDEILVDGLFDISVDSDVAEFELHGNLLSGCWLPGSIVSLIQNCYFCSSRKSKNFSFSSAEKRLSLRRFLASRTGSRPGPGVSPERSLTREIDFDDVFF